MSLVTDAANVVFDTTHSIDKIVGVWEGSFDRTSDVTARNYTFVGLPYTVYFYRIAHGFSRPIFTDLLWSSDISTWVDGGIGSSGTSGEVSISFSDDTYIYIYSSQGAPTMGIMYYKVIGFWIDNYDTSNPSVVSFQSTNKPVLFDSRLNYQKIFQQGELSFASDATNTVTHNLGRRSNFRVFFESFENEVWPLHFGGLSNPFSFADNQCEGYALMDDNTLNVTLQSVPATRRCWYRIYLDE